jgi:hypothetical protein
MDVEFVGDNPYFLVIVDDATGAYTGIDLDFPGWVAANADLMREPGIWYLLRKEAARPVLQVRVDPGDQPYYTARHVGKLGTGSNEITAYGIGKKQFDGTTVRLWVLPDGTVCGGEDVDYVGVKIVERMGPR